MSQVNHKIASLEVRAFGILRNRIHKLVIPLACTIDYYGALYQIQSPCPLSLNSLAYGSDTNGVLYKDDNPGGERIAREVAELLNL